MKVHLDFETRSELKLTDVGQIVYAKHPSTEIICLAYKINNGPTYLWDLLKRPFKLPVILLRAIANKACIFSAHNAGFEQAIYDYVFRPLLGGLPHLPPERWDCTLARCSVQALPRKLEDVAKVLELTNQKDTRGIKLIKKYMKPRPQWTKWRDNGGQGIEPDKWYNDELELYEIGEYCKQDVEVEAELDSVVPPLSKDERKIWIINQETNQRGVNIDIDAVKIISNLIKDELKLLHIEFKKLTGLSPNQVAEVLNWLSSNGLTLPNLQAGTIKEALKHEKNKKLRRVLELRQLTSLSSVKKYFALLSRLDSDGRLKDLSLHHGASTGREAGQGFQIHNLPRGNIKDIHEVIEFIKLYPDLDLIKSIYGNNVLKLFSSLIRGMVIASKGMQITAADYNAIECRIVNWLAKNDWVVDAFLNGDDLYKKMASKIFKKPESEITEDERFIGKQVVLGCGYGMGYKKFMQTCENLGHKVSETLAKRAVQVYRSENQKIVNMWANFEKAIALAIEHPDRKVNCHNTKWYMQDKFLVCELPSGRKLYYFKPSIRNEENQWGTKSPKIYFWGIDSKTKKWKEQGAWGGVFVENVTQATARDVMTSGTSKAINKDYKYMFQCHDEIITESQNGSVAELEKAITILPSWANGLPLKAKGWQGPRYKKG